MKGIALIDRRLIHPFAAALLATWIGLALGVWGYRVPGEQSDRTRTQPIAIQPIANPTTLLPARTQQTILVASFNIQAFGQSKVENPWVLERLAAVIRQFDVVAIQEVRSKDTGTLPRLLQAINQTGVQYQYLIGPRLGRTSTTVRASSHRPKPPTRFWMVSQPAVQRRKLGSPGNPIFCIGSLSWPGSW
jgi:hypothetical protein